MLNFQKLSLLWTLLFLVGNPATGKNHCADKCGKVRIEFPFYLRNKNLNHTTDYPPEFGLLCTQQNKPILELPTLPIQLFVREIDYKSTLIEIYDPQNCLPDKLLKLGNASISPFRFPKGLGRPPPKLNVSFFCCDSLSCPISLLPSYKDVVDPRLVSCTKLKDVSVEWWFSYYEEKFFMEWSKPDCGYCEAQGQKCKWRNGTNGGTECNACRTKRIPTSTVVQIAAVEDSFQVLYPEWVHNLVEGKDVQISLEDEGDAKIAKKLAIVGLWCIQWNPADRPSMKTVVQMLEGDGCELVAPLSPFHISGSSTVNTVVPARRQNFELEVIHEIEENSVDHF
ncbi:putative RING-H2 finger protein [Vigna angularis]|uniref:RING-type E3 ubiquitin transferase n=1 Tax=Phaseolus angularis TaxID=3914 RepID=A0A8T0JXV5_PHAAN|nr:putative RING-H2 finger protein [Vigna angularis]